jgi:hypothetical protein
MMECLDDAKKKMEREHARNGECSTIPNAKLGIPPMVAAYAGQLFPTAQPSGITTALTSHVPRRSSSESLHVRDQIPLVCNKHYSFTKIIISLL